MNWPSYLPERAMAREIPIQNLYYLLCYAWDQLAEGALIDIKASDSKSLSELFARVLAHGTQHLVKRGFDRGYIVQREETAKLRGRFHLSESMQRLSWRQGRMVCEFDELDHNILHNRILKSTMDAVLKAPEVEKETRNLLREQAAYLRHIDPIPVTSGIFRRVHLHRNNRFYRFLLNVCELIHDSKLPEEESGRTRFRDFVRDPKRMPYLFESFVKNFYAREQKEFKVGRAQFHWAATGGEESLAVLPVMKTDVSLWSQNRKFLMDCKFYAEAMSGWLGGEKLHAANLYQLYAYLRNAEHHSGWKGSEGILLYPAVSNAFDYQFVLDGHRVRVVSVNLDLPWNEIHQELLSVISRY
jgi:5-methylcytosine-specific restriction enzyme subunit McrC